MKPTLLSATGEYVRPIRRFRTPLPVACLAAGMLASYTPALLPDNMVGNVSYLGWMIPLCGAVLYLVMTWKRQITFPVFLWVPWIAWVGVYVALADADNALQRGLILLTPLAVGAAFSALPPSQALIDHCDRWIRFFFWVFLVAAGITTGLLSAGTLYDASGFAAGSITASLLASWYAVRYASSGRRVHLLYWAVLSAVPIIANTRTGMIAVAMTLPFVLAPWSVGKRVLALGTLLLAGLMVFQTQHIQNKMFHSGEGTLADAMRGVRDLVSGEYDASDFATSGRLVMTQALKDGLDEAVWFGHGANAAEEVALAVAGMNHPHNDWLRLRYEYGIIGTLLFGLTALGQLIHAWRRARLLPRPHAIFLYTGATAFLPMAVFMFSDNIILYAAWFGNLQFALLGLGYQGRKGRAEANRIS